MKAGNSHPKHDWDRWLRLGTAALLGLSLFVVAGLSTAVPASAAAPTATLGTAPAVPAGSVALGPMAASTPLSLDVVLAPRDPAAIDAFLQQLYDPPRPNTITSSPRASSVPCSARRRAQSPTSPRRCPPWGSPPGR